MSKKVKVLVSVLVAVVLLTVGGVATVMAQDEPEPTPEASAKGLLARVADILEIDQEALVSAFQQARQEIRAEALDKALDKAIEKGRIDETEASEIKEWLEQKPEVLDRGLLQRARISQAIRGRHMIAVPKGWCGPRLPNLAD